MKLLFVRTCILLSLSLLPAGSIAFFLKFRGEKAADLIYEAVGPVGPPLQPDSGSLFIVDESRLRQWRDDGHTYIPFVDSDDKDLPQHCVNGDDRRARQNIVVDGVAAQDNNDQTIQIIVEWSHVHSVPGLQRRAFCLYPLKERIIWLVHYLYDDAPPFPPEETNDDTQSNQMDDDLPLTVDQDRRIDDIERQKRGSSDKLQRKGSKRLTTEQRVHAEHRVAEIPRLSFDGSSDDSEDDVPTQIRPSSYLTLYDKNAALTHAHQNTEPNDENVIASHVVANTETQIGSQGMPFERKERSESRNVAVGTEEFPKDFPGEVGSTSFRGIQPYVSTQVRNVLNESIVDPARSNSDNSNAEAFARAMQLWKEGNEASAAAEILRANVSREYLQHSLADPRIGGNKDFQEFAAQQHTRELDTSGQLPSVSESHAVVVNTSHKTRRKRQSRPEPEATEIPSSDSSSSASSSDDKESRKKRKAKKKSHSKKRKHSHTRARSTRRPRNESREGRSKRRRHKKHSTHNERTSEQVTSDDHSLEGEDEDSDSSDEHYGVHSSVRASLWSAGQPSSGRSYALGSELRTVPGRPPMPPSVYDSHATRTLLSLQQQQVQGQQMYSSAAPVDHQLPSMPAISTNMMANHQDFFRPVDQQPAVESSVDEQEQPVHNNNFLSYMKELHQAHGLSTKEDNQRDLTANISSSHGTATGLTEREAQLLGAFFRGYQIRSLFRTKRAINLARQIKDAQNELKSFQETTEDDPTSGTFVNQLKMQVRTAVNELRNVTGCGSPEIAGQEWLKLRQIARRLGTSVEAPAAEREAFKNASSKANAGKVPQKPLQNHKKSIKGGALGKRAMDYGKRVREANLKKQASGEKDNTDKDSIKSGESNTDRDAGKPWKQKDDKKRAIQASGIGKGLQESGKWRLALEIVEARNLKQNSSDPNIPSAGPGMAQQGDQKQAVFKPKDTGSRDSFVSVCLMKKVKKQNKDDQSRRIISRRFDTSVISGTLNPQWNSTKIISLPVKAADEVENAVHERQDKEPVDEDVRRLKKCLEMKSKKPKEEDEENQHQEESQQGTEDHSIHNPVECFPDFDWNGFGVYFEIQDSDRFTKDTFLGCGELLLNDIAKKCRLRENFEEIRDNPLQKAKPAFGFPKDVSDINKLIAAYDNDKVYGGQDGESWVALQGKGRDSARGEILFRYRLIPPHPLLLTKLRLQRYMRFVQEEHDGHPHKSDIRSSGYGQDKQKSDNDARNQAFLKRKTKTPSFQKLDWSNVKPKTVTRPDMYEQDKEKEPSMNFQEKPGSRARDIHKKPPKKDYTQIPSKVKTNNVKREGIASAPRSTSRPGSDVGFYPSKSDPWREEGRSSRVSIETPHKEHRGPLSPEEQTAAEVVGVGFSGNPIQRPRDKYGRPIPQSVAKYVESRKSVSNNKKKVKKEEAGGAYARAVNQWQDMLRREERGEVGRRNSDHDDLEVDAGGAIEWMPGAWGADDRLWIGGKEWDEIDSQMNRRGRDSGKEKHVWPSVDSAVNRSEQSATEQAQWKEEAAEFAQRLQRKMAREMGDWQFSSSEPEDARGYRSSGRPPTPPPPPSSPSKGNRPAINTQHLEQDDSAPNSPRLQRLERVFADMLSQHSTPHPESDFTGRLS